MSRVGSIPDPFGSLLPGRRALTKVIHSLPTRLRGRITESSELLPAADPCAVIPEKRQAMYELIIGALLHRQRLRLKLRESNVKAVSSTAFDLYRLAWLGGQWALIGHSSADEGTRLFWLPWIEAVHPTSEGYKLPPRFNLVRFLKGLQPKQSRRRSNVHLRFSARVAPLIHDMPVKTGQRLEVAPDGTTELFMTVNAVDQILHWVLGFGDQVKVIEPQELKSAVCDWANRIIRQYQNRQP